MIDTSLGVYIFLVTALSVLSIWMGVHAIIHKRYVWAVVNLILGFIPSIIYFFAIYLRSPKKN